MSTAPPPSPTPTPSSIPRPAEEPSLLEEALPSDESLGIDDKEVTEQVTEAQVRAWCLENNQTLITTQSLEMDLRRRLASRTQYLPIHKSVADQFVTANLANTPLEFCTYLPPSTAHAPKILCAICVRAP